MSRPVFSITALGKSSCVPEERCYCCGLPKIRLPKAKERRSRLVEGVDEMMKG
jgi:hypothetical protein